MVIRPLSELVEHVRGRSVAIVGNAPSLLGSGLGSSIDACDLVVRMNNYVLKPEWQDSIGTRSDVYLCSFWYGHDKIHKSADEIRHHKYIICPFLEIGDPRNPRHEFAASLVGDAIVYVPGPDDISGIKQYMGEASPTTGFMGVYLLSAMLSPRSALMCGFDCFADVNNVHYFDSRAHSGFSHDPDREKSAFIRLVRENNNIFWHERRQLAGDSDAVSAADNRPKLIHLCKTDLCARREPDHLRLREYLIRNGHKIVGQPEEADCVILNTCSFNQHTEDNSISAVRELGASAKELFVVGCLPRTAGGRLAEVFNGKTIAHREFQVFDRWLGGKASYSTLEKSFCRLPVLTSRSEAFGKPGHCYQIQSSWGCNDNCAYCGDKAAVGAIESRPLQELISETAEAIRSGATYLAIVGDDVAALGIDRGYSIFDLLEAVVRLPGEYTLDLYEMNPRYLVPHLPRLARILASDRFGELTVAYQSGNDRILELMGRGYTSGQIRELVQLLHDHRVGVYAHVLVGMPGETEAEFEDSLELFAEMQIEGGSFFAYQDVARAPAHRFEGKLDDATIHARLRKAAQRLAIAGYEIVQRKDKLQCYHVGRQAVGGRAEADWMTRLRAERNRITKHFDRAVNECVFNGIQRVAIYGIGQHSWRLADRLVSCPLSIAGFIDDDTSSYDKPFFGFPVFSLADALAAGVQAVIISTDRYEASIAQRIRPALESAGVKLVTLYPQDTFATQGLAGCACCPACQVTTG